MKKLSYFLSAAISLLPFNSNLVIKSSIFGITSIINLTHNQLVNADPYNDQGLSQGKYGNHKQAIPLFTKAIENNPFNGDFYNNRGWSKFQTYDDKGALRDFDKAIELNPNNKTYYINRLQVRFEVNDVQGYCLDSVSAINNGWDPSVEFLEQMLKECKQYGIE